ncbi:MAG TPA: cupin domain-containing protein [Phycisphaerales bacterium]|nr:cupin domain-containing protein [Phycisphaerales bacterium]
MTTPTPSPAHPLKAFIVQPGEGQLQMGPGGDKSYPKITAAQSGGLCSLTEHHVPPGAGPPLHVHAREDEAFWVLEGTVSFIVGGTVIEAKAGSCVFGPRGTPHTFRNRTNVWAKMLLIVTPPKNFEDFYAGISAPGADGGPPSDALVMERIGRLTPLHGITILGPSPL